MTIEHEVLRMEQECPNGSKVEFCVTLPLEEAKPFLRGINVDLADM